MLLLTFACALRRAEAAALDVADLRYNARGLVVTLRRSKTDQEGEGREIAVPFVANGRLCAATHVRTWLDSAAIVDAQDAHDRRRTAGIPVAPIESASIGASVTANAAPYPGFPTARPA